MEDNEKIKNRIYFAISKVEINNLERMGILWDLLN